MKILILFILIGCAIQPTSKPKELTYTEQVEQYQLTQIDANIDKNKNLPAVDKKALKVFVRCVRQLIPNPHTISNLMPWQRNGIHSLAQKACDKMIREKMEKGEL